MRINKIDHTTGKIHPGGESGGFCTEEKRFFMPSLVKKALAAPTASGIIIAQAYTFLFITVTPRIFYARTYKSIPPISVT